MNAPENREQAAEIMFETFNVPGLYIAVQAVLALAASWRSGNTSTDTPLTGTVIDSGDGVTHIIPVIDGYVVPAAIKHIPIAGRDITKFIQKLLRERRESVASEDSLMVAQGIKEQFGYVAEKGLTEEFGLFDGCCVKGERQRLGNVTVGFEKFVAPEVFFHPQILSPDYVHGLPALLDASIQACPIDGRKALYKNIVLSGGSTLFPNFANRLERELDTIVGERMSRHDNSRAVNRQDEGVKVKVQAHSNQRHAVWCGGSLLASLPDFTKQCVSREEYSEMGPAACRQSRVFTM